MNVIIDVPKFKAGNMLGRFSKIIERNKPPYQAKIEKMLLESAREGHKLGAGRHYVKRSGKLAQYTLTRGSIGYNDTLYLYVNDAKVDYARWIHSGKRNSANGVVTWNNGKGDPFLDEALAFTKPQIQRLILELWNTSIKQFNRG